MTSVPKQDQEGVVGQERREEPLGARDEGHRADGREDDRDGEPILADEVLEPPLDGRSRHPVGAGTVGERGLESGSAFVSGPNSVPVPNSPVSSTASGSGPRYPYSSLQRPPIVRSAPTTVLIAGNHQYARSTATPAVAIATTSAG